jgi:hypothetical protein
MDVATGAFVPLPGAGALLMSPGGRMARLGEGRLRVLPKTTVHALPNWLGEGEPPSTSAFWYDERAVYVHQVRPHGGDSACRLVDAESGATRAVPEGCVRADFHHLYGFERGPGQLLAVYSAGEGHPGVQIVRFGPKQPQKEAAPAVDLYPFGPLTVFFRGDAAAVYLRSPCRLDAAKARPCVGVPEDAPQRWFRQALPSGRIEPQAVSPAGAVPSPDGAWLAFQRGRETCVARRGAPSTPRCRAPAGPSQDP